MALTKGSPTGLVSNDSPSGAGTAAEYEEKDNSKTSTEYIWNSEDGWTIRIRITHECKTIHLMIRYNHPNAKRRAVFDRFYFRIVEGLEAVNIRESRHIVQLVAPPYNLLE